MLSSVSASNGRNMISLILEWIVINTWASAYLHPCHVTWCVWLLFVSSIKHHLTHFIRCDFSHLGQIRYSWQHWYKQHQKHICPIGFRWQGKTDINQRKYAVQHNILIRHTVLHVSFRMNHHQGRQWSCNALWHFEFLRSGSPTETDSSLLLCARTHAHTHSRHADSGSWVVNSQRLFRSAFNAPAVLDSKICLHFCHFLSSLHFVEHSLPLSQNHPSPPTHTLTALRFYSHIIGFFR